MPLPLLSKSDVREFDRRAIDEFGVPGVLLMENAGRGVAAIVQRLYANHDRRESTHLKSTGDASNDTETDRRPSPHPVAICCGKGNNGGDGFVIARYLDQIGIPVQIHCWQRLDMWDGDAGIHSQIVQRSEIACQIHNASDWLAHFSNAMADASVVVDAVLGTGALGDPRPPYDQAITQMNAAPGIKIAVDIPSGLGADDGRPGCPTFRADHTCTFVAAKPGLVLESAKRYVGEIHRLDIGAPRALYEAFGIEPLSFSAPAW